LPLLLPLLLPSAWPLVLLVLPVEDEAEVDVEEALLWLWNRDAKRQEVDAVPDADVEQRRSWSCCCASVDDRAATRCMMAGLP